MNTDIGHLYHSVSGKTSQLRCYLCWVLRDEWDLEIQGMDNSIVGRGNSKDKATSKGKYNTFKNCKLFIRTGISSIREGEAGEVKGLVRGQTMSLA